MEWVGENEQLKRTKERKVILSESEFRAEAALPPIIIASHGRGRLRGCGRLAPLPFA